LSRELDEIKKYSGDYYRWALQARKAYIELRLRQDPEIRNLYIRAADRVAKEIRQLVLKTPSSYIQKRHLEQLEWLLREEADRFVKDLKGILERIITDAVESGSAYSQNILITVIETAGATVIEKNTVRQLYAGVNNKAIEACWARTTKGLYISDRIWQQGERIQTIMRDIIQEAVATGQDAVKTARMLERYVRTNAKTVAKEYPNMMERMAGRIPGNLSYEALRLARTEMTAAFGEGTIAGGRVSPSYKGIKWVLSKSHPIEDICDTLASADNYGLGPGVYPPGEEPPYPAHPNELCHLVPIHQQPEELVDRLKRWQEKLDSEPDLEEWYQTVYKKAT